MKMQLSAFLLLAGAGALLAGCTPEEQNTLPPEVTTALETAFARGDIDACVNLYAEDAEIISEDAPKVVGKDAIAAFFKAQVVRDINFDTDTTMNVVSGNIAVEQGTYQVRNVKSGTVVEHGEYVNIWKKDGLHWKNYRSMFNTTQGPRTAVSLSDFEDSSHQ